MDIKTEKVCPYCSSKNFEKIEHEHYSCFNCNQAFTEPLEVMAMRTDAPLHLPIGSPE